MPITIYPGSMKKRNANGSYSDLVPAIATDPEVLDDFAEEYSTSETYNIGDYCIHNSDLYKCNTNNTTGTWNNNAWDRVSVADELVDHKNTLNQLESEIGIVVDGKSCALGASQGQYVILKNSTISGKSDGLYTAAQAIPAGEQNVTSAMLTGPISGGGLNSLKNSLDNKAGSLLVERVDFASETVNGAFDLQKSVEKSGYYALGLVGYDFNDRSLGDIVFATSIALSGDHTIARILGKAASSVTFVPRAYVLYMKT